MIAKSRFTEGLVMDMSPEVTQNNCLTNALNATYITMNGNELQLQNDMGNAKFGAYLPSGYIPLGTTQLGGVIYVISYNPSDNKTQIGSFPSPQTQFLPSADMGDVSIDPTYFNTNLQYKKVYDNILMQPGDKFVFYFPTKTEELYKQYLYNPTYFPSGRLVIPNNHIQTTALQYRALRSFIKMDICTISQEGKLLPLDLRKQYAVPNTDTSTYTPVESDYNVYNSPVSGNLALVLSKVFCDNTTLQTQVLENPDDNETFILKFRYTFQSQDKFFFKKVYFAIDNNEMSLAGGDLTYDDKYTSEIATTSEMATVSNDQVATWYRNAERTMYKLSYSIILFKEDVDGKDAYLEIQPFRFDKHVLADKTIKLIDISRLGTGDVQLSQYQYKFLDKEIQILFGFDTFLNVNESIKDITINIYESNNNNPIVSTTVSPETSSYTVSTNVVNMNNVYITEFVVHILQESGDDETEDTIRDITITRWLITIDQLFDESQIDYDGKTTVYYWEKSIDTTLTLGEDTIEADYSNAWSLKEDKEPITLTEKHAFEAAKIKTVITYGSNVENVKLGSKSMVAAQPVNNIPQVTIRSEPSGATSISETQITVEQSLRIYTDYTIEGKRNHPQSLNGKYTIKNLLDIDYNRFNPNYCYIRDIQWNQSSDPVLRATGNSDIYYCQLFAENPNLITEYPLFTSNSPYPQHNRFPDKLLQGIYIRRDANETTNILVTNDKLANDFEYAQKVADTIAKNICVGFPNSDDIYYCIDFTSDSTKIDYVKSLQVEHYFGLKVPEIKVMIQNKTLEAYMDDFGYSGKKPKTLKVNQDIDMSKIAQMTNQSVTLPDINVGNYASIHNDAVFLHGSAIHLVQNSPENSEYTNKYRNHKLFCITDNMEIKQFKGSDTEVNGVKFNPSSFTYDAETGYLRVGAAQGTMYIENADKYKKQVCYIDYNSAIQ